MTAPLTCSACGHQWDQAAEPLTGCPRCGRTTWRLLVQETTARQEERVAYRSAEKVGSGRRKRRLIEGFARFSTTAHGPLAGTRAWIEQLFDRTTPAGRYRKRVTLSDGTLAKNVEGSIRDQSLHGPQQSKESSDDPRGS